MINFTRSFETAWERMHVILFRPFDLGKWFAIGFCAFLAGFFEGGNGASFQGNIPSNYDNSGSSSDNTKFDWPTVHAQLNHAVSSLQVELGIAMVVVVIGLIFAVILAFVLLLLWLGARGEFMVLDNIVRNRGAVSWPWKYYEKQANSLFRFYLLLMLISFALILPILGVVIVMSVPLFQEHRWPGGAEIAGFVALGLIYFVVAIAVAFIMFIFREFGIPLMFRQGLLARPAFWEALSLIRLHAASVFVFVLLRIALAIAVTILAAIVCCFSCCVEMIPYIGTVLLLPVIIYVRCFTLECLAQFGPRYEVWTVDVPPIAPGGTMPPLSPPLPPG